jgi:hypothetical protein
VIRIRDGVTWQIHATNYSNTALADKEGREGIQHASSNTPPPRPETPPTSMLLMQTILPAHAPATCTASRDVIGTPSLSAATACIAP